MAAMSENAMSASEIPWRLQVAHQPATFTQLLRPSVLHQHHLRAPDSL